MILLTSYHILCVSLVLTKIISVFSCIYTAVQMCGYCDKLIQLVFILFSLSTANGFNESLFFTCVGFEPDFSLAFLRGAYDCQILKFGQLGHLHNSYQKKKADI